MKLVLGSTLAALLLLSTHAHAGAQIARKISSLPDHSEKVGCLEEGSDCAEPPEVVTEFAGRFEIASAYCRAGSKVVSGAEVKFCKVPRSPSVR